MPKKEHIQRAKELCHCKAEGWVFPLKEKYAKKKRIVLDESDDLQELWPEEAEISEETPDDNDQGAPLEAEPEQVGLKGSMDPFSSCGAG